MTQAISALISEASYRLEGASITAEFFHRWGTIGSELFEMLSLLNGFYAFGSALLVRSFSSSKTPLGLVEWNEQMLWKGHFKNPDLENALSFAEDTFGNQFMIQDSEIASFDPESGRSARLCCSVEAWAKIMADDRNFQTGYPLAAAWEARYGIIPNGKRLLPKVPFILGGSFSLDNLYLGDDSEGMCFRASIATQIRDLPDGSQVVLKTHGSDANR